MFIRTLMDDLTHDERMSDDQAFNQDPHKELWEGQLLDSSEDLMEIQSKKSLLL